MSNLPARSSPADPLGAPLLSHPDIVVIGGGMAGVMAAIAAKTAENRVLIVEPSNVLGGQGTAGGVAGFCGDTARVNAVFAELIARLSAHALIEPFRPNDDRRAYDLEWCAFFLQEMVIERQVEVLLHARVIGARADHGRVTELTVSTVSGISTLAPRFVIDASGAGVVSLLTGFPVVHEGVNRQLPMSLYFTLWDTGRAVTPILPPCCPQWRHDDEIPMTSLHRFPTGKVEVKMKVVGFDAAEGRSRSDAEIFARRQMFGLIYYLQTVGYRGRKLDTHVLAGVSRGIGVREERRIVGEHVLTEAEARRGVIFPDAVAVNTYHIDYHWPDRMERAGTGITDMLDPHHLPLRMMIPRGAKNLLVPGRGASGDQTAMSAFRVMAVVAQMGFAAGHAARLCVETGTDSASIDIRKLQDRIEAGGQSLDLSDYGEYLRGDLFAEEDVFPGTAGFTSCEALALVGLRNGCFLAAWCGEKMETGEERAVWVARRRERQWSDPIRVATVPADAGGGVRLARSKGEIVRLELELGTAGPATWISNDEGMTWVSESSSVALARDSEPALPAEGLDPSGLGGEGLRPAFARLDDGTMAAAYCAPEADGRTPLVVALSADGGARWHHRREIEAATMAVGPSALATRTGLAILSVQAGPRLVFWHGSVERILHGPPKASAHVLQA
jgi:hypothetical protein